MGVRQFGTDTLAVRDEDYPKKTCLVDYAEDAVYGVELAFPESDDDRYRVDLVRSSRQMQGVEVEQRLTLAEYVSQTEAEEHLYEASTALYEQGRAAIEEHLPSIQTQPIEYAAGYMVASYPPDAVFTGESVSVSILALNEQGTASAVIGRNLSSYEASALSMMLEEAQAKGDVPTLIETAAHEAQARGHLSASQPLLPASPNSPTFYLDHRAEMERAAERVIDAPSDVGWGWHEACFAVLPPTQSEQVYQTALLDVYRDVLSGDLAGSYLPLGQHNTLAGAQVQCDELEAAAFDAHDASENWAKFTEKQVDAPMWQPMQPAHYALYERLVGREPLSDLPTHPEMDPLLAEALRLGAEITDIKREEQGMANTLKAERVAWQTDLNEHVSYLPPYVMASYRSPENVTGIAPLRIHPQGDATSPMYGFEVSAANDKGDVTLAAVKTFESDILQKEVTESAVLKTYRSRNYDESVSYLDPRSDAIADARALVYEWGRHDLDHAMGSALRLAQDNGFKGNTLFEHGPADAFTIPDDTRPIAAIHREREWERDAELFGLNGYKVPLPADVIHAREVGRYGGEVEVKPGLFYGVTVREEVTEGSEQPTYLVDGVKAWLEHETLETKMETVSLGMKSDRAAAFQTAHQIVQSSDVAERLETMAGLAHDFAQHADLPDGAFTPLHLRNEGLFREGPPDPARHGLEMDWGSHEAAVMMTPPPASNHFAPPRLDYSRMVGEAAYDLPLEEGLGYEFRMRPIPDLEVEVARYGVDALAVETVKHWQANDEPQQEIVTLGIYFDRDEAREEVDTYVTMAEREGIQSAMTRAAMLADVQSYPDMVSRAEELDLHLNPDVRFGEMFQEGPDDPFLAEREINYAAQQYAADYPPHHELSFEVVPVHSPSGESLGHSVVALDAAWEHDEASRDWDTSQAVTAYEVAQFEQQREADFYAASLREYLDKRDLETQGTNIVPALEFVQSVQSVNGVSENKYVLNPSDISRVERDEWAIQHRIEDFHPIPIQPAPEQQPVVMDWER
ncbi:MAG: hypothetical protein BroJett018_22080 [Chloroflexota bacterium]|nr:hypothetical protein [Chloroflexota bacterium]NOG66107.1 hypothetical protein [Chloroflexota bacterium]GIK64414.1 MAG: hypothetical protein BroJett018_22080 [Chloroflexota bacterium]